MDKIKTLLKQVENISDKYRKISIAKGENFNLFDVMGMRTDEVKTHSAIIAELLNPKGSHDLGDTFLKLFLKKLIPVISPPKENKKYEYLLGSNLEKTRAIVEYNIGQISNDKTEGGRIDILLSNDEFEICIENKINAGDQPFQLRRYHNHLAKSNKKTLLIYLTLDGKSASNESTCISKLNEDNGEWEKDERELLKDNKDYFCISYETEILSWLENCHKLTIDKPILRESLKQYILLIRSLTNQATTSIMANEIHQLILSDIESAQKIAGEFDNAIKYISTEMRNTITNRLKELYPDAIIENEQEGKPFSSIFIWFEAKQKHFGIESFKGNSIIDNSLFIGQMDWRGKESGLDIVRNIWIRDTDEQICDQETLYKNLQKFSQGDESVIKDLVKKIQKYIGDNL